MNDPSKPETLAQIGPQRGYRRKMLLIRKSSAKIPRTKWPQRDRRDQRTTIRSTFEQKLWLPADTLRSQAGRNRKAPKPSESAART
jgi:hypothetical protein